MKLTKQELRNILSQGWAERRKKIKDQKEINKKNNKKWRENEKLGLNVERRPHWIG